MSFEQTIKELKDKTCCQEQQLYTLREKLVTHDKVIAKNEELQCHLRDLKQWIEQVEFKEKQINNDLLSNLESQAKKLKKYELAECQLRTEKNSLVDINDRMTEQIRTLTQNEQKLRNSVEELTICKNRLQSEITNANNKIAEQNSCTEKFSKNLKFKEEESYEMRRQLDECKMAFNRLSESSKCQEKELDCVKTELMELKNESSQMQEKLKCEGDSLSAELQIKCQRLREIETEYDEAKQNLCQEKANVCCLETQMEELRHSNEKERCEANLKIQNLKSDICIKDESACRMKIQIADLVRENECKCTEIIALKTKIGANECLLEKIKHSSEVFCQMKNIKVNQLERDKSAMECDLKKKKRIIYEMEQEVCRLKSSIGGCCQSDREICCLKDKIKELECIKKTSTCCPIFPVSKCESSCTGEIKCSSICCPPLLREPEYGYPREKKCNESIFCSTNRISKCPISTPIKPCNTDNSSKCVLSELKQLYCDLEQLKDTSKTRRLNIC